MILVTVGANAPFDRLIRCVDAWAGEQDHADVFAQIGRTEYQPAHMRCTPMLSPGEFQEVLGGARIVVAHAGMGTILSALQRGIPILVMPRRADLHEQRNDHQLATARHLEERKLVHVAWDERELRARLDDLPGLSAHEPIPSAAPPPLVEYLRDFIANSRSGRARRRG